MICPDCLSAPLWAGLMMRGNGGEQMTQAVALCVGLVLVPTAVVDVPASAQSADAGPVVRPLPGPRLPAGPPVYQWFHGTVEAVGKDTISVTRPEWAYHTWTERGPNGKQIERKLIDPATTKRFKLCPELAAGGCPTGATATPVAAPFGEWEKNTHPVKEVRPGDVVAIWCPKQEVCEALCITGRPFGRIPPPPAGGTKYQERNAYWDAVEQGLPRPAKLRKLTRLENAKKAADDLERFIKGMPDLVQAGLDKEMVAKQMDSLRGTLAKQREWIKVLEAEEKAAPPPRPAGPRTSSPKS